MSIILLILKIIGIILLVLLGICLLALGAFLVVPIRYRVRGELDEEADVKIQVSWLLHIISFQADFHNKELQQKLRIFGILIGRKKKPHKAAKAASEDSGEVQIAEVPDSEEESEPREKTESIEQIEENSSETAFQGKTKKKKVKPQKKKISFWGRIKAIPGMIKSKLENLKEKVRNFRGIYQRVITELKDEANRSAVVVLFRELRYLLKHFSPRGVKGDVSFGFEDPSITGQILGAVSMFPFLYRYKINIFPDFQAQEFYVKGTFDIRGHARGIHGVCVLFRFLKDKNIRSLIQRYRKS